MIPILFEYNTTDFTTHGIGDLIDCVECFAQVNADGEYELSFSYPKSGELMKELTIGRFVYAKANPWQGPQIFRIYGYEKDLGGNVVVNCEHISYDLAKIPIKNFKSAASATANTVLADMKSNAVAITGLNISSFTFYSNVSGTAQTVDGYYELSEPSTARAVLLDGDDSIKGCFGGDLVFDNRNVYLYATGGEDRGVTIEYGVDLIDLKQEENISEMFTGVLPYYTYTDSNDNEQITYGSVQYASGSFRSHRVMPMSFNDYFPNQAEHTSPTAAQLNTKAAQWIAAEDGFGQPEVNLTLSYAQLGQDVRLHDAVTVKFLNLGVDVKSKVVSVKYDVLKERVTEVEVGKTKKSVLFSLEDASRLRKGLLPPARIKDKSITSSKYADGSIGTAALGAGSVTGGKIGSGAITSGKIGAGEVKESNLASNSVTTNKVKDLTINVNKIVDGAIVTEKIAANAVTGNKVLDMAISYAKTNANVRGNLDQVWINQADIAAINTLFANVLYVSYIKCYRGIEVDTGGIYVSNGGLQLSGQDVWPANSIKSWANGTFASSSHSHSGYASSSHTHSNYCTTGYASGLVTSHASHCANYKYQSY